MAPVTRRRTKALSAAATTDSENPSPASLRKKTETATVPAQADDNDEKDVSVGVVKTPLRKDLTVRTREDGEPETISRQRRGGKRSAVATLRDSQDEDGVDSPEPTSASKQLLMEAEYRASKSLDPEESAAMSSPNVSSQKQKQQKGPQRKHIVFGDNDDDDDDKNAANPLANANVPSAKEADVPEEEEEEDDDDDAPEVVSTSAAAKAKLKSEQAAQEAAAREAAIQKRKRQERDTLLKNQAEQKRKRDAEAEAEDPTPNQKKAKTTVGSRQRFAPRNGGVPDVLPEEFLTDSSSDEDEDESLMKPQPQNKIRFDSALETRHRLDEMQRRRPEALRDQVVGGTLYRVAGGAENGNKKNGGGGSSGSGLAPRMNKGARNLKEEMMRRNRSGTQMNKKKGFFVRK